MKSNHSTVRLLTLVMAVFLLLSQASCASQAPKKESNTQRLEIEDVPAVYNEAFRTDTAEKIGVLIERIVRLYEGVVLGETQKQTLRVQIEQSVLPALQEVPLYRQELEHLLQSAEELCSAAEEGTLPDASRMALFLRFYQSGLAEVDSAKLGALLYHSALCGLELLIDVSLARYDEDGDEWHLRDAEDYRAQRAALQNELGVDAFSNVTAMLTFAGSLLGGTLAIDDGSRLFAVSDAELVMLLQKQGDHFVSMELTERQWSVAAELLCAWIVVDGDGATSAVLEAMRTSGDVVRAAAILPAFFRYYQALTHALDELYLDAILSSNQSARFSAWVSVLVECEQSFLELDRAISIHATEGEGALLALQNVGLTEEYNAFLDDIPAGSAEELMACLRSCVNAYRPEKAAELEAVFVSYLRAYLPCLTFAFVHDQTEKGENLC